GRSTACSACGVAGRSPTACGVALDSPPDPLRPRRSRSRGAIDDREFLMIPGPVSVEDRVLEALARPVRAHYGDAWTHLFKRAVAGMREVFKTTGEVHLVFGSGMAGVEMCVASVLSRGDQVLVATNGLFGDRMAEVATANGLHVH